MSLLRSLRRLRSRPRLGRDGRWAALWLATAVGLEIPGRLAAHAVADTVLVLALVLVCGLTHAAHRREAIAWWGRAAGWLGDLSGWNKRVWGSSGVDLAGGDGVPAGLPVPRVRALAGVALLLAVALPFAPRLPLALRTAGLHTSYALYVAVLALLLALATASYLAFALFAAGVLGDARIRGLDNRGRVRSGPSPAPGLIGGLLLGTFVVALLPVPAAVPAVGLAGCVLCVIVLALLPRFRGVHLIWRSTRHAPRRASLGTHVLIELGGIGICLLLIVTLTTGLDLAGAPHTRSLPPTALVGRAAAWASLLGLGAVTWRLAALAGRVGRHDPSRPPPPVVRPTSPLPADAWSALEAAGWRIAPPGGDAQPGEVRVDPRARDRDLASEEGLRRLARRWEIVQRRHLRRGLQRVLRAAARFRYDRGSGFWIAPHLWIVVALSRDEDERSSVEKGTGAIEEVLGPDYAHVFPVSARAHALEVLDAVGVDLIFLEDGVRWQGLRRVLQVLFEVYDIHGGARRVQERDFSGLTGLRVVLHDFDIDNPYRAEGYPEPDYEDVARARVLHVFRDRGEDDSPVDSPAPGELVPLLA